MNLGGVTDFLLRIESIDTEMIGKIGNDNKKLIHILEHQFRQKDTRDSVRDW